MAEQPPKATRRPRGEPRRLLLASARDLFGARDYRSTTTRELAEHAGVAEHLLFRNFGSKAALFREALVAPFLDLVASLEETWASITPESAVEEEVATEFLGSLYDLFVENRGLVMTLLAADALTEEELEESGIGEIGGALAVLGRIASEGFELRGIPGQQHDLVARSAVAMVAGMAAFGTSFFGGRPPSRDAIVEELTQMSLHGFLHRDG